MHFIPWLNISLSIRDANLPLLPEQADEKLGKMAMCKEGCAVEQPVHPPFDKANMYMLPVGQRDSSENNQVCVTLLISNQSHLTCRKEEPQEQEAMGWPIFHVDGDSEKGGEGASTIYRVTWPGMLSHK